MKVLANSEKTGQLIEALTAWVGKRRDEAGGGFAVVGVRSRGDVIAKRVAAAVGVEQVGTLDITLYRDDLSEVSSQPVVRTTEIDFGLDGLDVVLIDDVVMSGRSVRAALQSLMDFGRPRRVWLAVLVDRGGRELPIQPDFAAMVHEGRDNVQVRLLPTDAHDAIEAGDES